MSDDRRLRGPGLEPFSLDLSTPLGTAAGEIRTREGFLVGVVAETDAGVVRGLGESTPLPGWTESLESCESALQSVPTDGWDAHLSGSPAAGHGYHLALLDAEARAEGRSLAALLVDRTCADPPAESVPVNATIGDRSVDETVVAAAEAVDAGFDCLKLKVGARDPDEDRRRVEAVVDAVDAAVRVDVNGAWDRATARELVDSFASLGLDYVEQPVPADDLDGLASLRGRGVDVAADESLRTRPISDLLDAEAADVAVLKPMALGGPAATVGLARHLRNSGVDPVVTTTVDGAVARAAAVHAAAAIPDVRPCGLATAAMLANDLGRDPVPVEDGRISVPDGPGNVGDRFDELVRFS